MAGVLVAYYSRSGVTEGLARRLAGRLGADLDPVQPKATYAGAGGFRKGVWQSLFRSAPPVDFQKDPGGYDIVILGSPVWAGRLSPPMRSYLKRCRGRIGAVAGFWVSGSGLPYKAVADEIERLAGRTLLASADFHEPEVAADAGEAKLEALALSIVQRKGA